MMARASSYRGLRAMHIWVWTWPHLGMRLPWLLDGGKPSVLLRVLQFLTLGIFFMLSLLLPLFLCLKLM